VTHPDWCERRRLCQVRTGVRGDPCGYHVADSMSFSDSDESVEVAVVAWHEVFNGEQTCGESSVRVRTIAGGVDEFCDAVLTLETARDLHRSLGGLLDCMTARKGDS
jgi:hypothetical protein